MDHWQEIGLIALGLWAAWERFSNLKKSKAETSEALASAAHDLVQAYSQQVSGLKSEISELRTKIASLEATIRLYHQCPNTQCPLRALALSTENS